MEGWEKRAQMIGSAGDGGMAGFGIRDGHVRAIRKVHGPRSYYVEFGSEKASEAGSKGSAISQEDETVNGDLLLNCNIAGLTPLSRVVDRILQERKKPEDITSAVVDEAAVQTVGRPLQFSEKQVKDALLPEACVTRRNLPGGPAPEGMKRMIEKARKEIGEAERNLEQRRSARKKAEQILLQTARRYLE